MPPTRTHTGTHCGEMLNVSPCVERRRVRFPDWPYCVEATGYLWRNAACKRQFATSTNEVKCLSVERCSITLCAVKLLLMVLVTYHWVPTKVYRFEKSCKKVFLGHIVLRVQFFWTLFSLRKSTMTLLPPDITVSIDWCVKPFSAANSSWYCSTNNVWTEHISMRQLRLCLVVIISFSRSFFPGEYQA